MHYWDNDVHINIINDSRHRLLNPLLYSRHLSASQSGSISSISHHVCVSWLCVNRSMMSEGEREVIHRQQRSKAEWSLSTRCSPAAVNLVITHYNLNANRVISSPAAALSSPTWWLPIDLHSSLISPALLRHHFLLIFHPCLKNCFIYGDRSDDALGTGSYDEDL